MGIENVRAQTDQENRGPKTDVNESGSIKLETIIRRAISPNYFCLFQNLKKALKKPVTPNQGAHRWATEVSDLQAREHRHRRRNSGAVVEVAVTILTHEVEIAARNTLETL